GPALHHRRRAEGARGAARARGELPRRGGDRRAAARRGDARLQAAQREGGRARRRRGRPGHDRRAQGGHGERARGGGGHAPPPRRPHRRTRGDADHLAPRVAPARYVRDARRGLRPARGRGDRNREDAQRAGLAAPELLTASAATRVIIARAMHWLERAIGTALAAGIACACATSPEIDPKYRPSASALEIIAVLERHVPDDTYRFEPARDFTDRNVYRSSLLRLENLEQMHADALRAGHLDGAIAFAKARALERLRAYDLAA